MTTCGWAAAALLERRPCSIALLLRQLQLLQLKVSTVKAILWLAKHRCLKKTAGWTSDRQQLH